LIGELSQSSPDYDELNYLNSLSENWLDTEKYFIKSLMDIVPQDVAVEKAIPSLIAAAKLSIFDWITDPSEENRTVAKSLIGDLEDLERTELLSNQRMATYFSEISASPERIDISSWDDWITVAPNLGFIEARRFAESAKTKWPIEKQLITSADVDHMVSLLDGTSNEKLLTLYQGLPFMVGWVKSDEHWPNLNYVPVYRQLLLLLLLGEGSRRGNLEAITDLFVALITLNADDGDYKSVLADLAGQLQTRVSNRDIDWLVDMVEITLALPVNDVGTRDEFIGAAANRLNDLSIWMNDHQTMLVRSLLDTVGLRDLIQEPNHGNVDSPKRNSIQAVQNLTVGIYTLTESVGRRAVQVVEKLFPGVSVTFNSDHTSTSRLQSLAQKSDLFVICWNSAKHAATDAIQDERRPEGLETRYATGTSSIVRAVTIFVADTQSAAA